MCWTTGVQFPTGAIKEPFSLLYCFQTGSGAHPASYPMGSGGSFLGGKVARAWTTHLHLFPKLKMRGDIPPLPQYAFMARCLSKGYVFMTIFTFIPEHQDEKLNVL
jgi:hypothetical protein